jgi:hypothetical protein
MVQGALRVYAMTWRRMVSKPRSRLFLERQRVDAKLAE